MLRKAKSPKYALTEAQRVMYASEKLVNFRWISKVVASYSSYTLSGKDLVEPSLQLELAEIGQYAEIASNNIVPVEFVFGNIDTLIQPDFPLENYQALQGSILVSEFFGRVSHLHAYVAYRPHTKQLIVATSGTTSLLQTIQDMRFIKHRHRSCRGAIHSGFWNLYKGVRDSVYVGIAKGFQEHEVKELVITGHSMGGAVSYLLMVDALTQKINIPPDVRLKHVSYGAPRVGDASFVKYWRELVSKHREVYGESSMVELCVKAYNDGVPSLPPLSFGYRHCTERPMYLVHGYLFHIPTSQCEFSLFVAETPSNHISIEYPKGGHNYYNGRDMERVLRRLNWLEKAMGSEEDWIEKYKLHAAKHLKSLSPVRSSWLSIQFLYR
ncbi:alpha/beta-hydrolase [Guyanagaster necrorhizus]|uniref:Alpha/beta-hydrolase n=1 Tax=Guyanagaster necrorhizus TaxID=856835 RepID=A0A9P7VXI2_9AGAR|nr:alpha/beta-hydrolase [Guyanagaster necrorhizus MCA 3950]KAG7448764.1 alpha/beta-hydrolase [Guyanagaster necrorhizus MCA 3950]